MNDDTVASLADTSTYRLDIDGMRTLAIVPVVLFHAGLIGFASGFVGVDIFFVISGYLIGGIIIRGASEGRFRFVEFYARRMRRILPALICVVLATCTVGWFVLNAYEYKALGATSASALLAVSNISFWQHQNYFDADSRAFPMLMTWSLGVEEQFYIIFPFIVLAVMKGFARRLLLVLAGLLLLSFGASIWCTTVYPKAAFFLLPSRAWELAAGALLAAVEFKSPIRLSFSDQLKNVLQEGCGWLGLGLIIVSISCFNEKLPFPGWIALLPVTGTVLLIWAKNSFVNSRLLSFKPVVFVGKISYSWYLWHWPVMSLMRIIAVDDPMPWLMILGAFTAFILAVLSWRFIEQPFRRIQLPPGRVVMNYAIVLSAALALMVGIKFGNGLPRRLSPRANAAEAVLAAGRGDCLAMFSEDRPDTSLRCMGEAVNGSKVALIGDSHASALGPGLRQIAAHEGWGVSIMTKSSCAPFLGIRVTGADSSQSDRSCATFMNTSFANVDADKSVKTVILAGYWDSLNDKPAVFYDSLDRSVKTLKASGKRVVLVEDGPTWQFDPVHMEFAQVLPVRGVFSRVLWRSPEPFPVNGLSMHYAPRNTELARMLERVASENDVEVFDLRKNLCDRATCRFSVSGAPLFVDRHHLSRSGASLALSGLTLKK